MVSCCGKLFFTSYRTKRELEVESNCVGCFYVCLFGITVIAILSIVICTFVWNKSYQRHERGKSSIAVEVRGAVESVDYKIWDDADLKKPDVGNEAFFVATKLIITNQTRGMCGESPSVIGANCTNDSDCTSDILLHRGHGLTTGKCIKSTGVTKTSTCEVKAWCPIQSPHFPEPSIFKGTENFTVRINNYAYFPWIKDSVSNIDGRLNEEQLQTCLYNNVSELLCPVFRLGDIVSYASPKISPEVAYDDIAYNGGIIQIGVNWDCNFDFGGVWVESCSPSITFTRLDTTRHQPLGKGYHYHTVQGYNQDDRQLFKVYGIFFVINVNAIGRKYSIFNVFTSLGSGFGLFGTIGLVCDFLINYFCVCHPRWRTDPYSCRSCSSASREDSSSSNFCLSCSPCCCIIKTKEDVATKICKKYPRANTTNNNGSGDQELLTPAE